MTSPIPQLHIHCDPVDNITGLSFNIHFYAERYLKHQIRHLNFFDESLDLGNVCPACPQVGSNVVNVWL